MVYTDSMFTVKQLAKIAGITPRTLHYYDEIGLLKPSHVGDNGYRYYEKEALLQLQQVLFYRELGIPLEKIKWVMERRDFDVMSALESHKVELGRRMAQLQTLMQTVDSTIFYLKGNKAMDRKQLFAGFSDEQQAEYEKEVAQKYDPATVKAANQKWKNASAAEKQQVQDEGAAVYQGFRAAMPLGAGSAEAQAWVERWRRQIEFFWTPNESQLLGLVDGYVNDARFLANFDQLDPGLAEFMRAAVTLYVEKRSHAD